jgi:hypothetical protein
MKYLVSTGGMPYEYDTPEGALCRAAIMIYFGQGQIADFRKTLEQGKELTITYGFKSVTITPKEEQTS